MSNQKSKFKVDANFDAMDSISASEYITKALALINQLEWASNQVDQNAYDDLNNRYSDGPTCSERLKLIANQFDTDDFLLSIIDQLRDKINDGYNRQQLYSITLGDNDQPLNDDQIQDLVPNHEITLRKVSGKDALSVATKVKSMLEQYHKYEKS
ncbi:hypothetical protein [Lactobacillus sp. Sy-1]|uniref:hypothetical protein n=1 Tax=Lactobacillus sp. Sy-1 TaxID=2109645 RepID=UPI001C5B5F13|nr:hypothetical protein [Lactobacillus sp. Sy-1]MBW1606247.1 hypothetical protein [Lactobacillus sp. Sy-1]